LVKELREKNKNILLLDGGDSIRGNANFPELRAETSMKALSIMQYDGMNIADGELGLGLKFFEKLREKAKFPLLSANLYKKGKPLGQTFLIKKFDGFNVGVIGLVSPGYFNPELLAKEKLEVKDPETELKEILPKVRAKADIIIFLSHLGKNDTTLLLQNVPGVDVAIIGHDQGTLNQPEILAKTILVQNSMKGQFLGILDLTIGTKGTIENYTGSMVGIAENIPSDPAVLALIREFEKYRDLDRAKETKKIPQHVTIQ
jgi:2',3'-cyclic-nucleotide 2'-phosphodiesterase (5'-nucleotidase family)